MILMKSVLGNYFVGLTGSFKKHDEFECSVNIDTMSHKSQAGLSMKCISG